MATISATQPVRTITPPSSPHDGYSSWDYTIPAENENSTRVDDKSFVRPFHPLKPTANHSRQPSSNHTDGLSKTAATIEQESPSKPTFSEEDYLAVAPRNHIRKKKSGTSRGSDDTSLDSFRQTSGSQNMPNGTEKSGKRKVSNGIRQTAEDDEENWIHRDKLAQIESRELQAAGFSVGRVSRSSSRSATSSVLRQPSLKREEKTLDSHVEDLEDFDPYAHHPDAYPPLAVKKQRIVSPVPAIDDDDDHKDRSEPQSRATEIVAAAEPGMQSQIVPSPPQPRLNGSRLPLPRSTPTPLPVTIVERDSPLARNGTGSETRGVPELRQPSRSIGSKALFDEEPPATTTTVRIIPSNDNQSSSKSKVPKGGSVSSARRASQPRQTPAGSTKARVSSQPSRESPKKPGTSSGRPSTGHRPEGDPPWIASMYKPDPRLPPDQQILPTHAKRMAQEQWEREGKIGTVYDRDFRLLNSDELMAPEVRPEAPPAHPESVDRVEKLETPEVLEKVEQEDTTPSDFMKSLWPLNTPPTGSLRSNASPHRPGTSATDHGGYKMMPTIHTPPPSTPLGPPKPITQPQITRMQAAEEDVRGKKEKGVCCCIVM